MAFIANRHFAIRAGSGLIDLAMLRRRWFQRGRSHRRTETKEITMSVIGMLEAGRSFAERIPYSLLALASRFAVASIFWRSLYDDRRGTPVPGAADHRVCLATVGAGIIGHDECDPAICLSERVAPARPLDRPAAADHRPGTGRRFARSSRVESAPGRQDDSAESRCSPIW